MELGTQAHRNGEITGELVFQGIIKDCTPESFHQTMKGLEAHHCQGWPSRCGDKRIELIPNPLNADENFTVWKLKVAARPQGESGRPDWRRNQWAQVTARGKDGGQVEIEIRDHIKSHERFYRGIGKDPLFEFAEMIIEKATGSALPETTNTQDGGESGAGDILPTELRPGGKYGTCRDLTTDEVKAIVARFYDFKEKGGKLPAFYEQLNITPGEPRSFELETLRGWTKDPKFTPEN